MKNPILVPNVQHIDLKENNYIIPKIVRIDFGDLKNKPLFFLDGWINYEETDQNADITFLFDEKLHDQGYKITVDNNIVVEYSQLCGAFYALTTLKQLFLENGENIRKLTIEDWPDIEQRGLMLDVSRGRLTKISVIKDIVDWLVSLKYNQLQLYFDAIVFDYSGFEEETSGKVLYTPEEIRELSDYCSERFMQLVPNQNSFGHMNAWLSQPKFSNLAITKDDGTASGVLNPLNSASLDFMDKIYGALLPNFKSEYVNIGCDETWELGMGETKEVCEQQGKGKVYLDYLLKLYDLTKEKYNCIPMFWDDIAMHHPELITQLPKDIIVLEWGYEFDHPFEEHCKVLHDAGLRFYVSPGTSTWTSLCGRTVNMFENLRSAGTVARKYKAEGYLLTDWGDGGMPQPMATSLISYVAGGLYSWHARDLSKEAKNDMISSISYYADKYLFKSSNGFADWIIRLGKFSHLEHERRHNSTVVWQAFWGDTDPIHHPTIKAYIENLKNELPKYQVNCKYGDCIKDELNNVCLMMMMITDPIAMEGCLKLWQDEYIRLWDIRSKHDPAGYELITKPMESYFKKAKEKDEIFTPPSNVLWFL